MGFDFKPFDANFASNRREYGDRSLSKAASSDSPFVQFEQWFSEVLLQKNIPDPTAMVLSTVDARGYPNSRVVLLKGLEQERFIFYTNYESTKALELAHTPYVALNFYWPMLARQVRVRGTVQRVSRETSEAYFATRHLMSQCSAIISPQSREIPSRAYLLEKAEAYLEVHAHQPMQCPPYWGGFAVIPEEIEFWQGRDHRLHDRIRYIKNLKKESDWTKSRLAS